MYSRNRKKETNNEWKGYLLKEIGFIIGKATNFFLKRLGFFLNKKMFFSWKYEIIFSKKEQKGKILSKYENHDILIKCFFIYKLHINPSLLYLFPWTSQRDQTWLADHG